MLRMQANELCCRVVYVVVTASQFEMLYVAGNQGVARPASATSRKGRSVASGKTTAITSAEVRSPTNSTNLRRRSISETRAQVHACSRRNVISSSELSSYVT